MLFEVYLLPCAIANLFGNPWLLHAVPLCFYLGELGREEDTWYDITAILLIILSHLQQLLLGGCYFLWFSGFGGLLYFLCLFKRRIYERDISGILGLTIAIKFIEWILNIILMVDMLNVQIKWAIINTQ
jgi:hypothetical protein